MTIFLLTFCVILFVHCVERTLRGVLTHRLEKHIGYGLTCCVLSGHVPLRVLHALVREAHRLPPKQAHKTVREAYLQGLRARGFSEMEVARANRIIYELDQGVIELR